MNRRDCPFCRIVIGADSADIVYETSACIGFIPLDPATAGHTLLIPREHVESIWELNGPLAELIARDAIPLVRALRAGLKPDGLNVITSAGEAASQSVMHLHLHLVPRYTGDRFGHIWPPSDPMLEVIEDDIILAIRNAVAAQAGRDSE